MKLVNHFMLLAAVLCFSSCAAMQTAGTMQSGRQALFRGDPEAALVYFREVAAQNPDYVYGSALRQGIWSYVGRAEYLNGQFPQAQRSLERALAANQTEDVARLYLGLSLARGGDYVRGVKEIEEGMKGIHGWLEYVAEAHRFSFGQFWDPGRDIRNKIEQATKTMGQENTKREEVLAMAEWLGKEMEEEVDRAQRQESQERSRNGGILRRR